jgi:hypothetical protein
LDLASDYRLRFLQDQYNVQMVPCHAFHPPNPLVGWLIKRLNVSPGGGLMKRARIIMFRVLRKVFYNEGWAGKVLDVCHPAALVFEESQGTTDIYGKFLLASRKRGTPALALPHGLQSNIYQPVSWPDGQPTDHALNIYDRVVNQSYHIARWRANDGVIAGKLAVLGSTRYCHEWQSINLSIQPKGFKPAQGQGDRLGVAFMFPRWSSDADFDAAKRTLLRLSSESWLHLVIKPDTRKVEASLSFLRELQNHSNVEVNEEAGSVPIIAWSDAVVVAGSSISLEVLLQGKPHLAPSYLGENFNTFQETGAQWTVNSDDELLEALEQIRQGHPVPYTKAQIDDVMRRLVLGELDDEDVLGRYADFVLGGWRDFPTYQEVPV